MRFAMVLLGAGLVVAGCAQCDPQPDVNVGIGVGSGGATGGVSVGQSCGPVRFSVGTGDYWHIWL